MRGGIVQSKKLNNCEQNTDKMEKKKFLWGAVFQIKRGYIIGVVKV